MSDDEPQPPKSLSEFARIAKELPKPSEFYRHVRPELFSDTKLSTFPILTKAMLEFHLDQLTTNKKEQEFEEFCRRLAEREICPNLVPQTGPVGGGDSKVDSATYPVSAELAERRYWGGSVQPSQEDWAFAFTYSPRRLLPAMRLDVHCSRFVFSFRVPRSAYRAWMVPRLMKL